MAKSKECVVCGTKYEYCGNCNGAKKADTWRNNFCSENCRDLFKTASDFAGKLITVEDAKRQLSDINLNINYTPQISGVIAEILTAETAKKEVEVAVDTETKVAETSIEKIPTEEVSSVDDKTEEMVSSLNDKVEEKVETYNKPRRRRNRKSIVED